MNYCNEVNGTILLTIYIAKTFCLCLMNVSRLLNHEEDLISIDIYLHHNDDNAKRFNSLTKNCYNSMLYIYQQMNILCMLQLIIITGGHGIYEFMK